MTVPEWKKVARLLKEAYAQLETEALSSGTSIFSEEYKKAQDTVREAILTKMGFTLDEYRAVKDSLASANKQKTNTALDTLNKRVDALQSQPAPVIPTKDEIVALAHEVAKEYIVAPIIKTEIVKETIVEKPQILETVRKETIVQKYDATKLEQGLKELKKQLSDLKIPEAYNDTQLKEYVHNYFAENFEKNIDTLGMPDFRKLAMGLQDQIDSLSRGGHNSTLVSTSTYTGTQTSGELSLFCDATSNSITVYLPTAVGNTSVINIKKTDSGSNTVTIDAAGTQTIDGSLTQVISFQNNSISVVSDGSNWGII